MNSQLLEIKLGYWITNDQMGAMVRSMMGKQITYADLIADNGIDSKARA